MECHTDDYVRHGTTDLFAARDVEARTVLAETHWRDRAVEFRKLLDTLDRRVPGHPDIHLVLAKAATHKAARTRRLLPQRSRDRVHSTSTSTSWFDLVECWLSLLQRREPAHGVYRRTYDLEQTIHYCAGQANAAATPLEDVARFCSQLPNSDH